MVYGLQTTFKLLGKCFHHQLDLYNTAVFTRHNTTASLINAVVLIRLWRGANNERGGLRIMNPVVKSTKENVFPQHSSIDHTVSISF